LDRGWLVTGSTPQRPCEDPVSRKGAILHERYPQRPTSHA
jgi:hypothetical protein